MERNWKNFKLDKNKLKIFIAKVIGFIMIEGFIGWTIYQGIITSTILNK